MNEIAFMNLVVMLIIAILAFCVGVVVGLYWYDRAIANDERGRWRGPSGM